jgi:hypothetical protein
MRACADELASGQVSEIGASYVATGMAGHNWNGSVCFDADYFSQHGQPQPSVPLSLCTFEERTSDDRILATAKVVFASTTDHRFFAWTVSGTSN